MTGKTVKLKAFIASSTQSLEYAYAVQSNLAGIECTVWDQDVFDLNGTVLDSLEKVLEIVDFGVFVFGNDDVIVKGGTKVSVTRDNVIYELGLFTGRLGRGRIFIIRPKTAEPYHLPTDLVGITIGIFDGSRTDENWVAALGPACNQIRKKMQRLGPHSGTSSLANSRPATRYVASVCCRLSGKEVEFLLVQTTRMRWIFPKGKVREGESLEAATLRYAHDEGGVFGEIIGSEGINFRHLKEEEGIEQTFQVQIVNTTGETSPTAHFRNPRWVNRTEAHKLIAKGRTYKYIHDLQNVMHLAEKRFIECRQHYVVQAAVIPYRKTGDKVECLMVTSTETQQWLFPKGTIEEGESAQQAAAREAFEEGGVRGTISAESVGIYEYEKLDKFYRVEVFLLQVNGELENWPEDKIRRRSWFEVERAATIVQEEYLKQIIVDFKKRLSLAG